MILRNPVLHPSAPAGMIPPGVRGLRSPGGTPGLGSDSDIVEEYYNPGLIYDVYREDFGSGDFNLSQSLVSGASNVGQSVVKGAASGQPVGLTVSTSAVTTAGEIATGVINAAWAVPVIGAAVAGVTYWLVSMFRRNAQKREATRIVEQIEPKLIENLRGYLSGPRTRASQLQALANFDAAWEAMKQACRNSALGSAGERCISDRDRGACVWRARCVSQDHGVCVEYALDPGGDCWNWFVGYRDPIEKDPVPAMRQNPVVDAAGRVLDPVTGLPVAESSTPSLYLLGGLGLIAAALFAGGKEE